MSSRKRRSARTLIALASVGCGLVVGAAPAAAAADRAACVAVLTHDPAIGAPGVAQRQLHWPGFGAAIASIAAQPKGSCAYPFGGSDR